MADPELRARISADTSGLTSAIDKAQQNIKAFKGTMEQATEKVNVAGVSLGKLKDAFSQSATAGASAGGIIAQGIQAIGTCIKEVTRLMNEAKELQNELAEMARKSLEEVQKEADEKRKANATYLDELKTLQSAEKLSETQKVRQIELLQELTRNYGKLGFEVDAATGKIKNFDEESAKIRKSMIEARIKELEGNRAQNQTDINAARGRSENAGTNASDIISLGGIGGLLAGKAMKALDLDFQVGGQQESKDALKAEADARKKDAAEAKELARLKRQLAEFDKNTAMAQTASARDRLEAIKNASARQTGISPEETLEKETAAILRQFEEIEKALGKTAEVEKAKADALDAANVRYAAAKQAELDALEAAKKAEAEISEKELDERKSFLDALSRQYDEAEKQWTEKNRALWKAQQSLIDIEADIAKKRKQQADSEALEKAKKKLSSYGFSIPEKKPKAKLDKKIAEKLAKQDAGEKVSFTKKQRRRIAEYKRDVKNVKAMEEDAKKKAKALQEEEFRKRIEAANKQIQAAEKETTAANALLQAAQAELRKAGLSGNAQAKAEAKDIGEGQQASKKQKAEEAKQKVREQRQERERKAGIGGSSQPRTAPGVPKTAMNGARDGQLSELRGIHRSIDDLGKNVFVVV